MGLVEAVIDGRKQGETSISPAIISEDRSRVSRLRDVMSGLED